MDFELWQYALGLLAGIVAGIINTLAGNGSSLTLYVLMDIFALPPTVANATNRIGVGLQGFGSLPTLYKSGNIHLKRDKWIYINMCLGSILGVVAALNISDEAFRDSYKYILLLLLGIIVVKPERWLREDQRANPLPPWLMHLICWIIGFYGGFIQMGMGLFLLMFLVLGAHYKLKEANGIKNLVTFLYTAITIGIFAFWAEIAWTIGLLFGIGQFIGAYLGAKFETSYKNATIWSYRLLVTVVIIALVRLFFF